MDAEQFLNLFDSYWFDHQILTKKPHRPPLTTPDLDQTQHEPLQPSISNLSTRHVRSSSDQLSSETSFSTDFSSPKSVIPSNKLQTIPSGKEVQEDGSSKVQEEVVNKPRRKKKRSSKSLSDLEFEELKGFMDLGFVFSEEDKNSELVSIIPGLQRLGKSEDGEKIETEEEEEEEEKQDIVVSRPYLSEAWDVMGQRKQANPLMNWRIPSVSNELDMKDHLKFWAHIVASTAIR